MCIGSHLPVAEVRLRMGRSRAGRSDVMASGENLVMRAFRSASSALECFAMTAVTARPAARSGWFGLPWLIAALGALTEVGVSPQ